MVTIYVESRTVRVRMPVVSFGRWSGALIVRILQDRCEDHLDQLTQVHATRMARRADRARRFELARRRVEAHERDALGVLQGRGF